MNFVQYTVKTNFGAKTSAGSTIVEYGSTSIALVDHITLPDGTEYSFSYEQTPGSCTPLSGTATHCVTGRIASVTLPTGGEISYGYAGGTNGIFSDGSTAGLNRSLSPNTCSSGGCWQYSRALQGSTAPGPGSTWVTTVSDPQANQTLINFAEDSTTTKASTIATYNMYETQRQTKQLISGTQTLLLTTQKCYNANYSSCATATVGSPISTVDSYSQPASGSTRASHIVYNGSYNGSGLVSDDQEYGYGVTMGAAPSATYLIRDTATAYASLGNGIVGKPSSIIVSDWSSGSAVTIASTSYKYDEAGTLTSTPVCPATGCTPQHISISGSRGNVTTATMSSSSSASLSKTFTSYDTGNSYVATDVNGVQTTYSYGTGSCGNSFPTGIAEPLSLSRSITWDCTGGMATRVTDENGNNITSSYIDPNFWRPASVSDQANNETTITYIGQTAVEGALTNFNGGNSVSDSRTTVDDFGRVIFNQRLQGPGATNYDTAETDYNDLGQPIRSTMPYSAAASPSSSNTTAPAISTAYDALGRVTTTQDANGGTVSYTYTKNDVLQEVSGAQTFQKQFEYDGLGRLTSVCEMSTTLIAVGACGQAVSQTGYLTKYAYDALGRLLGVTQNAQPGGTPQIRSFVYDWLGRITSETNPESGTTTYFYDSFNSGNCNATGAGDLLAKLDATGNESCYVTDALHRLLSIGQNLSTSNTAATPDRCFFYDSATVNGVSMSNAKTRLAHAYTVAQGTGCSASKLTDEGFSYSVRGELTDVYESTPHSGGYYHTTAAYWPTGTLETLSGIPGVPTIYYGTNSAAANYLDGEGRYTKVTAGSGTNPVTSVTYSTSSTSNPLGALTGVTFGSSDSDSFSYDPNTGRMGSYTFSVNGKTDAGTLTWNPNGTLQKLVVNDQIPGTSDSETCNYLYDDLRRVSTANCGALWGQNFTYDAFGNIAKNVISGSNGLTFAPMYAASNRFSSIPGVTVKYDSDGNLLTDNLNTYTWNAYGQMVTVNTGSTTVTATYDALGRMVENNAGGTYTELVLGPTGAKLAKVNGTTLVKAFVSLPGGAKAVYTSSGLAYFRHSDWLGSSRLTSTAARGLYSSSAYAPFGEQYATAGTGDPSFTGQDPDTVPSLYDFPARRQSPSQGRWISPDPAGRAAVTLTKPQSWNRYAYALNDPLALIDPMGMSVKHHKAHSMEEFFCGDDDMNCGDDSGGGDDGSDGDNNSGDDDNSGNGNDPNCDADACVTADAPPDVTTQDSTITCNTIAPAGPVGPNGPVSVAANVQQGQQEQATAEEVSVLPGQESYLLNTWTYQQFQTGGPQDYKNQPWGGPGYADFGNFNYGAVCGAEGFSLSYCQSAAGIGLIGRTARLGFVAGLSQSPQTPPTYNGQGVPFISPPYGDQPGDSQMISQGYAYQAQGCSD
jgi:RHS repeat-associated protein